MVRVKDVFWGEWVILLHAWGCLSLEVLYLFREISEHLVNTVHRGIVWS